MIKRCFSISLAFLSTILFICSLANAVAESEHAHTDVSVQKSDAKPIDVPKDSVLHLIPKKSLGLIYCPSLSELNNRINLMTSNLMPQAGVNDLLAKILAGAFGVGFESLTELEEIGLDLDKDFAVFITNVKPMHVSAIVHLTDPDPIKQVIAAEAEGSAPIEYKGVTYWSSAEGGGNFAILENILVFSVHSEVCKNVIDTRNGTMQAITHNADNSMFRTDILNGTDQLGVFLDIEAVTANAGTLKEELESMTKKLDSENESLSLPTTSTFQNAFDSWIEIMEQLQSVSATLQLQETDVQLKPFLKFKTDSEFMKDFKVVSNKLPNIGELPNLSIVNGTFQGVPKLLVEISTFWFDVLPKDTPGQQKQANPLFQDVKAFYESLADRWSVSVNFENSILPGFLFIYELRDEQSTKDLMKGLFLEKLHHYHDAYAGKPIMHNGVEIKSYVFPNFKATYKEEVPENSELVPTEWHWYYAFSEGKLFWTTGTNSESLKIALDRKAGMEEKFSANPSYQKLVESLGTDNNIFLAVSPIIAVKNFVPLLAKVEPNSAASIQMFAVMFANLPDNYSFGFSAKVRDNGIDSNIFLAIGDFKTLIQMFGMMFSTL